jgi:hypothetical protein
MKIICYQIGNTFLAQLQQISDLNKLLNKPYTMTGGDDTTVFRGSEPRPTTSIQDYVGNVLLFGMVVVPFQKA